MILQSVFGGWVCVRDVVNVLDGALTPILQHTINLMAQRRAFLLFPPYAFVNTLHDVNGTWTNGARNATTHTQMGHAIECLAVTVSH